MSFLESRAVLSLFCSALIFVTLVTSKGYPNDYDIDKDNKAKLVLLPNLNGDDVPDKTYTPVLFWHGMGDCARCSIDINRIALQRLYPGIKVFSVQIGSDSVADRYNSYIGNANKQIAQVCSEIIANPIIKRSGELNLLGFSQGCQLLRGLVQRCPLRDNGISVKNFISLGGQHQGVFGLPNCEGEPFCKYISVLSPFAYRKNIQERSIQAQYWHDPMKEDVYKHKSIFLADINNEIFVNQTYKENLLQLHSFVLVEFGDDEIVIPRQTSLFGYYAPDQTSEIVPLEESELYLKDKIGIKQLAESQRLHKITIPGNHLQYNMTWFTNNIAKVYFDN